jgi:hypothetical protein
VELSIYLGGGARGGSGRVCLTFRVICSRLVRLDVLGRGFRLVWGCRSVGGGVDRARSPMDTLSPPQILLLQPHTESVQQEAWETGVWQRN